MSILDRINGHSDLVDLTDDQRTVLCSEIREFLISSVAKTGGHLASNLGIVELSVALETVFNTESDRLVFDVGHQSYVHKLLTGRKAEFEHLRQYGGMAGFPKPSESVCDAFVAGHASNSVSIALGMARARTLTGGDYHVVALIGDGATTGGLAYEGLNDAGDSAEPLIVILNDNKMSIDHNVGGMSRHLARLRMAKSYFTMKKWFRKFTGGVPGGEYVLRAARSVKNSLKRIILPTTIFESMGFTYLGPVDGHDLPALLTLLKTAKDSRCPVLIHVITRKGKGYLPAEENPAKFHGIGKFDPETGMTSGKKAVSFSDSFGNTMVELAEKNDRVCAITAAMPGGTGLLNFKRHFPDRTFDVGIAEEHAVSMAGGLAKQGMVPVVAIYSTFLQRAYDMIQQDVAMLGLHVVFAVDRAGLVGEDGETHHGIFDVGFLRQAPGMTLLAPVCTAEQRDMLHWAVDKCNGPVAVRYPRGGDLTITDSGWNGINAVVSHRNGTAVTLITYGTLTNNVIAAADKLAEIGINATVLRLMRIWPLPLEELCNRLNPGATVAIIEETCNGSGIREALGWELRQRVPNCNIVGMDLGSGFVPHGSMDTLYRHCGLDSDSIVEYIREVLDPEDQKKT